MRWLLSLSNDLHHSARLMARNPGYAITAMLCLSLGIGVNTTMFSLLDGMFLRPLPVPEANRVMRVDRDFRPACSWREYLEFRDDLASFDGMAALIPKGTYLDMGRVNHEIYAEVVSANFAGVLKIRPRIGRWLAASDELPASQPVAVISDRLWERHFHRDSIAIGRTIRIENQWYTIVGVAEPVFHGVSAPLVVDAWVPLVTYPHYRAQVAPGSAAGGPGVFLIGRLRPGRTPDTANAEIRVIDARLRSSSANDPRRSRPMTVRDSAGAPEARRAAAPIATLFTAVTAIVLLIACVNVANLLLARATVRRREMAVRLSLGATRGRLLRQGLSEGLVLAAGGAVLGLLFGLWVNRAMMAWLPAALPEAMNEAIFLEVNWRVAAFTALASVLSAILFSLSPALESARTDFTPALKGESGGSQRSRQRDLYVVAQVALSLVLLIGAGLLLRALRHAANIQPGFATDHRIYVRLFTPVNAANGPSDFTPETSTRLFSRLVEEARGLPGVRDATLSFAILGFTDSDCATTEAGAAPRRLNLNVVEPNYFEMMQVPLLRGRNFGVSDRPGSRRAVIVNETMARQWWPGEDAVGRRLWFGCCAEPRVEAEVIGVARDSKYVTLDEEPHPFCYVSARQVWWNGYFALILHTAVDPYELAGPLLRLARTGGPNLRISDLRTMDEVVALSLRHVRLFATLLAAFGLLAIVLASLGLYGVVAYSVAQRTREIGVRMALGAQRADVQRMVLSRALRLTAVGIAAGLLFSFAVTRFLRSFLYGLSPLDPAAFAAASLVWILIAMLASYLPSRRATRVDPVVALRYE